MFSSHISAGAIRPVDRPRIEICYLVRSNMSGVGRCFTIKKLTPEEKQALEEKLRVEGHNQERGKPIKLTLPDDKKEKLKEKIAQAERERLELLDKRLHSRKVKKK